MNDIVIRNGTIVDGTGAPPFVGDLAIKDGRIVSVGGRAEQGVEEIHAENLIVTPGFVDIHTHYDAQATWDSEMAPSAWHGVTTAIMGNCGVGFAPVTPEGRDFLVRVMEGVEQIPGAALSEGMRWDWETFPEYLDALDRMPRTIDLATHIPHSAVRAYAMGGADHAYGPASPQELDKMVRIVEEGLKAGALGFSTNRSPYHQDIDGVPIPGTDAPHDELMAIGRAMARVGHGVLEVSGDPFNLSDPEEWRWMSEISRETGVPVSYELVQPPGDKDRWKEQLDLTDSANATGAKIRAQVAVRGIAMFMNWQLGVHPFVTRPSWKDIANKSWAEQLAALRDPSFRKRMLSDPVVKADAESGVVIDIIPQGWHEQFYVAEVPDYEPDFEQSVAGIAEREGRDPAEVAYDLMMENDGNGFLYVPLFNYADGDLDAVAEMLKHPATIASLSDGGAHATTVCDVSAPTFLLTHWARDRRRGTGKIALEEVVRYQTMETADLYGLYDRGRLAPGMLADVNVIDLDRLHLPKPYIAHDLPGGCLRLMQRASGYVAIIKSGVRTFENDMPTGATPGRVVRGQPRGMHA